jgi:hypothetical protein
VKVHGKYPATELTSIVFYRFIPHLTLRSRKTAKDWFFPESSKEGVAGCELVLIVSSEATTLWLSTKERSATVRDRSQRMGHPMNTAGDREPYLRENSLSSGDNSLRLTDNSSCPAHRPAHLGHESAGLPHQQLSAAHKYLCAALTQLCAGQLSLCAGVHQLSIGDKYLCAEQLSLCTAHRELCAEQLSLYAEQLSLWAEQLSLCAGDKYLCAALKSAPRGAQRFVAALQFICDHRISIYRRDSKDTSPALKRFDAAAQR